MITKEDYQLWKLEPVTRAWFEACHERISESKDLLALQAGLDPVQDSFMRGFIYAYNELLDFRIEEDTE